MEGADMTSEEYRSYQLSQMELLLEVDRISKLIGIQYYLIGGTLLGAVRHKGFIPWDADIDIAMVRKDYEVFLEYCANAASERYFCETYKTEKNHTSPHAVIKIKGTHIRYRDEMGVSSHYKPQYDGIYLDIFPLDEPPKDPVLQERQAKRIKRLKRVIELKQARIYGNQTAAWKRIAKKTVQIALSPISLCRLNKMLDNEMMRYNGCGSEHLVSMASHYSYRKQYMEKEVYGTPQPIVFEGFAFSAPQKIDYYLTRIYGDYMKLPPADKQYVDLELIKEIDYGK